jgi:hypothetical protein
MPKQFFNAYQICSSLKQVGGKRMREGMDTAFLFNTRLNLGLLYYFLNTSCTILATILPLKVMYTRDAAAEGRDTMDGIAESWLPGEE